MKKSILLATAIVVVGLMITSAASIPVLKNTGDVNELTVTKSDLIPQKLSVETSYVNAPLIQVEREPTITEAAFAFDDDQVHPALAKSGSIHMAGYRTEDIEEIIWTFSTTDGPPYDPGIYYEGNGDYPSLKLWTGQRFFGTFVTDYLDLNGGPTYLYEINDVTQLPDNVLNPMVFWDWSVHGWSDMIDADIACDSSQNTWEWGVSAYVTSSTYGDGYTDGPTITYSDEDAAGSGWISWYYYDGCDHCDIDIDNSIIYSYAVYDWEDTTAGYYKLLCRVNDFDQIMSGYDEMFEIDDGSNLINPAVAAGDGNIVILAETDVNGNQDIICFYGTDLNSMSSSFVVDTGDDEMYPDVRHVDDDDFVCTYVKGNNLYALKTEDGGANWIEVRLQINDNNGCVVEEYKTSDLCEKAAKAMWEEDCDRDNIDIWIGDVYSLPNDPPGAPTIDGPASGSAGTLYDYDFSAIDPDGDQVQFYIEWGDTATEWTSLTPSNTPITASHTWVEQDDYVITAKAKDEHGLEGPETTLSISMPRNRAIFNFLENYPFLYQILQYLFGI